MAEHRKQSIEYFASSITDYYTLEQCVLISFVASSNSQCIINDEEYMQYEGLDENMKIPYIKIAEMLHSHKIKIKPSLIREVIFYINGNSEIKTFWDNIASYSPHIVAGTTRFLTPPVTKCIDEKCSDELQVASVEFFQCLTENDDSGYTVAEISLRCRNSDCDRFELRLFYNYYMDTDGKQRWWSSTVNGPDRFPVEATHKGCMQNKIVYFPLFVRAGKLFYTWNKFLYVQIESVYQKSSFSAISKTMKLKSMVKKLMEENIIDYNLFHKSKYNSQHMLNAWVLWRCLWFEGLITGEELIVTGFNSESIKILLHEKYSKHEEFVWGFNREHKCDTYGCCGPRKSDGLISRQILSDGVCTVTTFICAANKHDRNDGVECHGVPPGRGKRVYCHDHVKFEHFCRAYMEDTNEFCDKFIVGELLDHCVVHDEYTIGCADCHEAPVCENHFCSDHIDEFEEKARKKLENDKKYFHRQKMAKRKGAKKNYSRNRDNLENKVEDEEKRPKKWNYHVGKCFNKGYMFCLGACGWIYCFELMATAEAPTQHIKMVSEFFGDKLQYINYFWVDFGCKVLKCIINNNEWTKQFAHTKVIVDRFHGFFKHNQKNPDADLCKFCLDYCDVSTMTQEKLNEKYPELIDDDGKNMINSAAAEQLMNVIGGYKHVLHNMLLVKQKFYMLWGIWDINQLKMMQRHNKVAQVPGPTWPY
eukprot:116251_1